MLYSHSRLEKYNNCNGAFYRKYILGMEEPPTLPAVIGKVGHTAIAHILQEGISKDEAVARAIEEEAVLPVDAEEIKKLISMEIMSMAGQVTIENVEKHFVLPLSDDEDAPKIQGYKDIEFPYASPPAVYDWKSNWREYKPTKNHQLGLYAWAQSKKTGAEEIEGHLFFLRKKKSKVHLYTKEDMEKARKWAYDLAMEIEGKLVSLAFGEDTPENLFPSIPCATCRYCGYAEDCLRSAGATGSIAEQLPAQELQEPQQAQAQIAESTGTESVTERAQSAESAPVTVSAASEAKEIGGDSKPVYTTEMPKSEVEAIALAAEILRMENVLSSMKERLKDYVKEHKTSVKVDDVEFGYMPSTSWAFDPEQLKAFAQYLVNKGINPWENLSLGANNITKLKKNGITDQDIEEFAKRKTKSSFRSKKAKEESEEGAA